MTNHLEERALSARRAVEDATAAVEPGIFVPTRPRAASAVIVAIMLGAIGLGGWWLAGEDADGVETVNVADDERSTADTSVPPPTTSTTSTEITDQGAYLVLDQMPGQADRAMILPAPREQEIITPRFDIYGRAGADNPYIDGNLAIGTVSGEEAEALAENDPSGEAIQIGETTAWLESESPGIMTWMEPDGSIVGLLSTSMNRGELLGAATSIINGGEVDAAGLDLLAEDVVRKDADGRSGLGRAVVYANSDDDPVIGGASVVSVEAGNPPTRADELLYALFAGLPPEGDDPAGVWSNSTSRTITHEGRDVLVITRPEGITIVASETDVGPATITAFADTPSDDLTEILALFPSLRPATEDEVDVLLEAGILEAGTMGEATVDGPDVVIDGIGLANGTRPDGSQWAVSLDDSGGEARLCSFDSATASSPMCVAAVSQASTDGTRWLLADEPGVAMTVLQLDGIADVDRIELVDDNGVQDLELADGPAGTTWFLRPGEPLSGDAVLRVQTADSAPREIAMPDATVPPAADSAQLTIVVMGKP